MRTTIGLISCVILFLVAGAQAQPATPACKDPALCAKLDELLKQVRVAQQKADAATVAAKAAERAVATRPPQYVYFDFNENYAEIQVSNLELIRTQRAACAAEQCNDSDANRLCKAIASGGQQVLWTSAGREIKHLLCKVP
jgi:hypothetical protein